MDQKNLENSIGYIDYLGSQFYLHFENFKEAQNEPANMVMGGVCDRHLSDAILSKVTFEEEIEKLRNIKWPIFGKSDLKLKVKQLIYHSEKNIFQMDRVLQGVDRSFLEGAAIILLGFGVKI